MLAGGDPGTEIAAAAEREGCDLVAMSTHGHKGVQDLIRGSVANEVRHRTTVPVLMVRGVPRVARSRRDGGPVASPPLTGPVEDYLKAIYDLERDGEPATTNDIALRLAHLAGVGERHGAPSRRAGAHHPRAVSRRASHAPTAGTPRCARSAAIASSSAISREVLGYPWDRVHDEAEQLEHAASEELIERMAAALGDPVHDPHGAPIPTREGVVEESDARTLAELGQATVCACAQ